MTDVTTQAILDATRSSVLDFGVRRTTLTDIARRAGVSRMTVYRRYPDVDAVLRDLMTREFGATLEETALAAQAAGNDGRERISRQVVAGVGALRAHPLLRKVVEAEPELLLPYVLGHLGASQRHALVLLTAAVAAGQADGSVREGDPERIARSLLLVAQSFLFSDEQAGLDAELERIADGILSA
ncbi:MAG: TetR/AcrR family transcriptional regulator [Solirubrobacteraceae bacterium]|nr:TetR/AcrR family transcriptional regulator [Solirubrobacteraceae bacterium]